MSKNVIEISKLGKSYIIGHKAQEARYTTLRDKFSESFGNLWSRIRHPEYHTHENIQEFWALKDIDLEVKQGERLGIIGRNGAGKTTLLKLLSRITEPTTGQIRIKGRIASLLEIGTGFHPELTGRENVYLNGAVLGMTRAEIKRKFDEIVDFAGVEQFLDTPVKRYSSGMLVRLGFSVAAHLEPEILLVDEVLAVGDFEFQKKCLGKMEKVSNEGRTVLFVSHNLDAVNRLCSQTLLLNNGQIEEFGDTGEIISLYSDKSVDSKANHECPVPSEKDKMHGFCRSITFEDMDNNPQKIFPAGEPFQIRVRIQVNWLTPSFIVGIGISTSTETPICTTWAPPLDLKRGQYEFVFLQDQLEFSSGKYSATIGLSFREQTIQFLPHVVCFEIGNYALETKALRISGAGILLNQMQVQVTKV